MKGSKSKYDVVIIGGGLSGLLCGYILSREGMKVAVLDKGKRIGGCLQSFKRNGLIFDTGVHYIGSLNPGQTLYRYWKYFGLTDAVKFERLNQDGFDRILIEDKEFPISMGFDNFIEQLTSFFPSKKNVIQQYINILKEISTHSPLYNLELPFKDHHKGYSSTGTEEFFRQLVNQDNLTSDDERRPSTRLASVLAGNNFLYGGDPSTSFSVTGLINHSFISSAWRPLGGSEQIAKYLVREISRFGGECFSKTEVTSLKVNEGIFKLGTSGFIEFTADRVISSASPSATFSLFDSSLIRQATIQRINSLEYTQSSFATYLELKEKTFLHLDHNYHIHRNDQVWDPANPINWPHSCMVYTIPDPGNEKFAKGIVIMSPMRYSEVIKWEKTFLGNRGPDYNQFKKDKAEQLLKLAEIKFTGLRSSTVSLEISSPLTWRDYTGTPEGSMYGILRDFKRPDETVIFPRTKIPGVYLTGQSTNIHGVLGVTIGAVMTCGEIIGLELLLKKIRNG